MSVHSAIAGIPVGATDWHNAARLIDHTLLKPAATRKMIGALCDEALQWDFQAVMVNPCYVTFAAGRLRGSGVKVGTVVGFPLGATLTTVKLLEAETVIRNGAQEIDFVINIGALKSGDRLMVQTEMRDLARLVHKRGAIAKAILEMPLLSQEEKILACALALEAGVDFVKSSTGFADASVTVGDIALMRGVVGLGVGVKAAGGIRTAANFADMVDAGANRIGTSRGVEILREMGAPEV